MERQKVELGPEIWERVFSSSMFRKTMELLLGIFERDFGFYDLNGITFEEFSRIPRPNWRRYRFPFCEYIWQTPEGKRRCLEEEKRASQRVCSTKDIDIITCWAGLVEIAVPILLHGNYCGFISTAGGLCTDSPTEEGFDQIARRVADTGVDLKSLKEAYLAIKPISKELLDVMVKLINIAIEEIVGIAVESERDKKRIRELEDSLYERYGFGMIIGKSNPMQEIFKLLAKVVKTDAPILIEGESGTGKELIANTIHYNSHRKAYMFTAINCAAFSEQLLESELFGHLRGSFTGAIRDKKGLFEVTDQGTLFLDEIAEMSPALQVKLLRVLQDGTFLPVGATQPRKANVRLISATNKDLKDLVSKGKFRQDLFYRLNVIRILIPPLRERKEDIPLLVNHFINRRTEGITSDALKLLLEYHWPGNVRELQNVIERAISLTDSKYIEVDDLPEEITGKQISGTLGTIDLTKPYSKIRRAFLESFQKEYLCRLLKKTAGNVTKAARIAGLNRCTLQQYLKRHGINSGDFREG
jgi:transcriptional regulator with PAS, ATPase and Fis domain